MEEWNNRAMASGGHPMTKLTVDEIDAFEQEIQRDTPWTPRFLIRINQICAAARASVCRESYGGEDVLEFSEIEAEGEEDAWADARASVRRDDPFCPTCGHNPCRCKIPSPVATQDGWQPIFVGHPQGDFLYRPHAPVATQGDCYPPQPQLIWDATPANQDELVKELCDQWHPNLRPLYKPAAEALTTLQAENEKQRQTIMELNYQVRNSDEADAKAITTLQAQLENREKLIKSSWTETTALRTQLDEMKHENEFLLEELERHAQTFSVESLKVARERDEARQDKERLREALQSIVDYPDLAANSPGIARAALASLTQASKEGE